MGSCPDTDIDPTSLAYFCTQRFQVNFLSVAIKYFVHFCDTISLISSLDFIMLLVKMEFDLKKINHHTTFVGNNVQDSGNKSFSACRTVLHQLQELRRSHANCTNLKDFS